MNNKSVITIILLSLILVNGIYAKSSWPNQIPNGSVYSCLNCHVSTNNFSMNKFGQVIKQSYLSGDKINWNQALAQLDSDGDGFTNGTELQDPNGLWKSGDNNPGNTEQVTNPGNANSVPTGILEDLANYGFSVTSVSPNPFSNGINISLTINVSGKVAVSIFDIKGNLVKNLIYEQMEAGNYIIKWDGTDNMNGLIPNNTYFLNIQSINQVVNRKIVLLR
jgi:hypothetical protein